MTGIGTTTLVVGSFCIDNGGDCADFRLGDDDNDIIERLN